MLDFICMGPVDLSGARRKRQNTKWKILALVGLEPTTLSFEVWCSTDWTNQACWKLCYLNGRYTYMYFRYQCIHWFKFENDESERILTCKWTVLWSTLEYMYIVQIAKKHTSPLLASNMHIPNQVECLVVFAYVEAEKVTWQSVSQSLKIQRTQFYYDNIFEYLQMYSHCIAKIIHTYIPFMTSGTNIHSAHPRWHELQKYFIYSQVGN